MWNENKQQSIKWSKCGIHLIGFVGFLWIIEFVGYEPEAPLPRAHSIPANFICFHFSSLGHWWWNEEKRSKDWFNGMAGFSLLVEKAEWAKMVEWNSFLKKNGMESSCARGLVPSHNPFIQQNKASQKKRNKLSFNQLVWLNDIIKVS